MQSVRFALEARDFNHVRLHIFQTPCNEHYPLEENLRLAEEHAKDRCSACIRDSIQESLKVAERYYGTDNAHRGITVNTDGTKSKK